MKGSGKYFDALTGKTIDDARVFENKPNDIDIKPGCFTLYEQVPTYHLGKPDFDIKFTD